MYIKLEQIIEYILFEQSWNPCKS